MKSSILLLITSFFLTAPAIADENTTHRVVELFTSQGCSSCPPANEMVNHIADEKGTLALTYGVTYWDYLGWKDTFAKPEFTRRQRVYGHHFDMTNLYTPQIVLNGSSHGARFTAQDVHSMTLSVHRPNSSLSLTEAGLEASILTDKPVKLLAILVEYVDGPQSVSVNKGENQGRTLTLSNIVTDVENLGIWESSKTIRRTIRPNVNIGKSYALLMHNTVSGKIVAAASYTP